MQTSFGVSLEAVLKSKAYTERGFGAASGVVHAAIEEGDEGQSAGEEDLLGLGEESPDLPEERGDDEEDR